MKAFPLLLQAEALLMDLAALPAIKLLSPLPGAKDLAARRTRRTSNMFKLELSLPTTSRAAFTTALESRGVKLPTADGSFGQDPSNADDRHWPIVVLTINPSVLSMPNAEIVAAFEAAVQAAEAAGSSPAAAAAARL